VPIAGGYNLAGVPLRSAELYDPSTGIFTPTGDMTMPRAGHNAVLLNTGKVFIVGGEASGSDIPAELFDPDSGTFTATGSFPGAAAETDTATLLADGRVLIVTYYSGLAGIYDPATGFQRHRSWTRDLNCDAARERQGVIRGRDRRRRFE
jgi:hypothetical protein